MAYLSIECFNLVIEVLVVSRVSAVKSSVLGSVVFQSRNRGTCRFKIGSIRVRNVITIQGFNLVIEVLVVSSRRRVPIRLKS